MGKSFKPKHGMVTRSGSRAIQRASTFGGTALSMALFDQLATGFDTIKSYSRTGTTTEKKVEKLKPRTIALGWYVDYMSGFNHQFPKSYNNILDVTGRKVQKTQTPNLISSALARVGKATILSAMELATLQAITDVNVTTYLMQHKWKTMFTNLSNVKQCYEFYYVTPIGEQATSFEQQITTLTNSLHTSSAYNDVFTMWKPSDTPEVLKNWRIFSKSVFRLGPGETGEIHGKDNLYQKIGDAVQLLDRTYAKSNTQLYCRYYGAPTGIGLSVVAPAEPVPTQATFGANNLKTAFVTETTLTYYQAVQSQPNIESFSTTVANATGAGEEVITQAEDDQENVPVT